MWQAIAKFLTRLINIIQGSFRLVNDLITKTLKGIKRAYAVVGGMILALGTFIIKALKWGVEQLETYGDTVNGPMSEAQSKVASVLSFVEKVNCILPIDEIISAFTVYMTVWMAVTIYRIVKSWIPSVSS